jgi:hypothetical protein
MILLSRNDTRGAKRRHPRVEELIKIPIHDLITNKPWARTSYVDNDGNRFHFIDEIVRDEQRLTVYINGLQTNIWFRLVDMPIRGRIKNEIPWDRNRTYYVLENSKRYRALYINPVSKQIGTRYALRAVYTSEAIGRKRQEFWRQLQRVKRQLQSVKK